MEDGIMVSDDKSDIQIMSNTHIVPALTHSIRHNTYRFQQSHSAPTHIVNEVSFLIKLATTYQS